MMAQGAIPVISSTGLFTPSESISNEELVESFNAYVDRHNAANPDAEPLVHSSVEFIEKASGIKSRHVIDKASVLDPDIMCPRFAERPNDEIAIMAEIGVKAAKQALERAGREVADVDAVLCAASNMQRGYPAMAVEIQAALGMEHGFAFDMNVACSSATFSIQAAVDALRNGSARCVVVVNPEITSGHNNFELRDFHFIFGDACTALVLERSDDAVASEAWAVLGTKLATQFSNNIRNDAGFLNPSEIGERDPHDLVFRQRGQQVFREVCPMVSAHILAHLAALDLEPTAIRRFWLHQANLKMNQLIAKGVLGRIPADDEAPVILDEYANTSSAGSIIAFHLHRDDLSPGDLGVICSFGAGYSVGSVVVQRVTPGG